MNTNEGEEKMKDESEGGLYDVEAELGGEDDDRDGRADEQSSDPLQGRDTARSSIRV